MNLKQKLSAVSAAVLPALALAAYLLMAPAKASACQFYAPCSGNHSACSNGAGGCYGNGSCGVFIFCYQHSPNMSGVCNNGCVTCEVCH